MYAYRTFEEMFFDNVGKNILKTRLKSSSHYEWVCNFPPKIVA
jgi:hypothetical protein